MNFSSSIHAAAGWCALVLCFVPACDKGSVGSYGATDGAQQGTSGRDPEPSSSTSTVGDAGGEGSGGSGTSESTTASAETAGSTGEDETDGTGTETDDPRGGEMTCGCPSFPTEIPSILDLQVFCGRQSLVCPGLTLDCGEKGELSPDDCVATAVLSKAELDAMECQLSFLQGGGPGRVRMGMDWDSGYEFLNRELLVGSEGFGTGFWEHVTDSDGPGGASAGGDLSGSASACVSVEDDNERLLCLWALYERDEILTCE